jgi:hypothetical protein
VGSQIPFFQEELKEPIFSALSSTNFEDIRCINVYTIFKTRAQSLRLEEGRYEIFSSSSCFVHHSKFHCQRPRIHRVIFGQQLHDPSHG